MNLPNKDSFDLAVKRHDRFLIAIYFLTSVFVFLVYAHFVNWGPYASQIVLLKAKQNFGKMSSRDFVNLAKICEARAREKCVRQAYKDMYSKTYDVESFGLLAQYEFNIHDIQSSIKDFDMYYRNAGKDPQFARTYALALEQNHDYNSAIQYFKLSARQNRDQLGIFENREILKILMLQKKYHQAEAHIENFWSKSKVARAYFNFEASEIKKALGSQDSKGVAFSAITSR